MLTNIYKSQNMRQCVATQSVWYVIVCCENWIAFLVWIHVRVDDIVHSTEKFKQISLVIDLFQRNFIWSYRIFFGGVNSTSSSRFSLSSSTPLLRSRFMLGLPKTLVQFLKSKHPHPSVHPFEFLRQPQWPSLHPVLHPQPAFAFDRFGGAFCALPATFFTTDSRAFSLSLECCDIERCGNRQNVMNIRVTTRRKRAYCRFWPFVHWCLHPIWILRCIIWFIVRIIAKDCHRAIQFVSHLK